MSILWVIESELDRLQIITFLYAKKLTLSQNLILGHSLKN